MKKMLIIAILSATGAGSVLWLISETPPVAASGAIEPEPKVVLPLPEDERLMAALRQAVLDLPDNNARDAAREKLRQAADEGLAVLVDFGLYHEIPLVRTYAASALAELGNRRVLKFLIEAFHAASVPTIPPYQREYVKVLREHVSRLTGEDFFFYIRRTTRGSDVGDLLVAWWENNWDRLPPQLGEPKLAATRFDYMAVLRKLRTLNLEPREFPGSNLPAGITSPLDPPRPADVHFRKDFPVESRKAIDSKDKRTREIPTVPKESIENRDRRN